MTDFQLCMFLVLFSRKDSQIQKEQNFEMNLLLYSRSVIRMMDMQITKRFSSSKMKRYRLGSSVCTRTVFLILLHTPSFLLEIRVIIKILSHPWYHINCDGFEKGWSKKIQNGRLKKTEIFNSANSQYFFAKISGIGSWVNRINWCKGYWCSLIYLVIRLTKVSSKKE